MKFWHKNSQVILKLLLPVFLLYGCASISQLEQTSPPIKNESKGIEWQTSYDNAIELAKAKNKPLMLVFYGVSGKRLEENVFSSPNVIKLAQEFVCIKMGSDQNELAKKYGIFEYPTVVFADPRGGEYDRILGYKSESSFVTVLSKALTPIDIEYNIQIDIPKNQALVKCALKNIRQKSLILYLWENSIKPTNISYNSTDGRPTLKEVEENYWQMDFNTYSMKTVTIQYEIPLSFISTMDFNPAYISYVGEKYGILDGHVLFLAPYNFHINGKIKVILNLPNGWKALTPWEEESPLTFSANYIQDVVDSVFCIGQFQSTKRSINNKEVYAVYCGSQNIGSELEQKADIVAQIFKDYMTRFGDFPFKKYVAIFAERISDGKYIHGTAHGSGFAGPIEMEKTFTSQFTAHEIFHIWNGRILVQKSQYEVWFKEGFTQYYGYITPYRIGLYSKEQFISYLKNDYREYMQKYEASEDIALSRVNEGIARKEGRDQAESIRNFIMYRKGALIASLMDDEIIRITDGKKSLDDLISYMLVKYRDKEYSTDDILTSINAVTDSDFTKFFSDFIYGRTKLPLSEKD
jgi:hypothetical protein